MPRAGSCLKCLPRDAGGPKHQEAGGEHQIAQGYGAELKVATQNQICLPGQGSCSSMSFHGKAHAMGEALHGL